MTLFALLDLAGLLPLSLRYHQLHQFVPLVLADRLHLLDQRGLAVLLLPEGLLDQVGLVDQAVRCQCRVGH